MPNMWRRASLGRSFGWLWAAYAVSAYGTGLGFGAFSVVAITVLNAGSAEVAALSSSGLAFIQPGVAGLVIVMATEFGLIVCIGIFNSVFAAYRLTNTDTDHHARVLTAWSVSTSAGIAALTLLWGLLAQLTGPRAAIALAGVLLLATPFLLPRPATTPTPGPGTGRPSAPPGPRSTSRPA